MKDDAPSRSQRSRREARCRDRAGDGSERWPGETTLDHVLRALPELAHVTAEMFQPFRAMVEAWDRSHGWRSTAALMAYAVFLQGLYGGVAEDAKPTAGGFAALVGLVAAFYQALAAVSILRGLWQWTRPHTRSTGGYRRVFEPKHERGMLDPVDWDAMQRAIAAAEAGRAAERRRQQRARERRERRRRAIRDAVRWLKGPR